MSEVTIIVKCNGEWNGNKYIGDETFMMGVPKNVNFSRLMDFVYIVIGIDGRIWDIRLHYLLRARRMSAVKIPITTDLSVRGVISDKKANYREIYFDKNVRDSGGISPTVPSFAINSIAEPRHVETPVDRIVSPTMAEGQNCFVSYSGSNQVSASVAAFTSIASPMCDIDFNKNDRDDEDRDTDSDGDGTSGNTEDDDEEIRANDIKTRSDAENVEYPEVRFSGSQFEMNASQPYWIVPGVNQCKIEATSTVMSTFIRRDTLYRGAFFYSKYELNVAVGKCVLDSRYQHKVRRSCTVRYEVGCMDLTCSFEVRARCRKSGSMWYVYKYVPEHTCCQDAFKSHRWSVKTVIIVTIYQKKVGLDSITPQVLIAKMLEQYGVQIMYTKAWRSLQYAKKLAYRKTDDSFQQLPRYLHMLKETNLGTLTTIETDENHRFLYSFVAFGAAIEGFRSYIRSVIAVDATHLKGEYKGVIFVAACKDGEEMSYPIAFGFDDGESNNS